MQEMDRDKGMKENNNWDYDYVEKGKLSYNKEDFIYTDGSVLRTKEGQGIGSGIYWGKTGISNHVSTGGRRANRTINRAELMPILVALLEAKDDNIHILSDSLTSIHQIHGYLRNPNNYKMHKHEDILKNIAIALRARADRSLGTNITKVPAHRGIMGNEKADEAAKETATGKGEIQEVEGVIEEAYRDCYWLAKGAGFEGGNKPEGHYISGLGRVIRKYIKKDKQDGRNKGIYQELWEDTLPLIDPLS